MIAEQPKSPPGLPLTINFKIPADWTPEQALAVFELLDDLRIRLLDEAAHARQRLAAPVPELGNALIDQLRRRLPRRLGCALHRRA